MKLSASKLVIASTLLLSIVEMLPSSPVRIGLVGDAQAIIGRPMTPVSYAGVARRTAYRETAVVATAAVATTAAVAAAEPKPVVVVQAPAPAPAPVPATGPLPVGLVVAQLPAGCVSAPVSGVEYYLCGGNYYRASFQGNNLVYVVQKP